MAKWRISYGRYWVRAWFAAGLPGYMPKHPEWCVFYNSKVVGRYRSWDRACQHVKTAHEKFGL